MPVLGVIFLRHATNRYDTANRQIAEEQAAGKMPKRSLVKQDFIKRQTFMLPKEARYDELLKSPKGAYQWTARIGKDAFMASTRAAPRLPVASDPFVAVTAQTMREGSKMPCADWKQMQRYVMPMPPDGLLSNFESAIQSIVDQRKTLTFANQKLRAARDLLLPRLMTREITI